MNKAIDENMKNLNFIIIVITFKSTQLYSLRGLQSLSMINNCLIKLRYILYMKSTRKQ